MRGQSFNQCFQVLDVRLFFAHGYDGRGPVPAASSDLQEASAKATPFSGIPPLATSEPMKSMGTVMARIADRPLHDEYQQHATFQFGLSSIMLIITLAAVLLGVYEMAPGIGIALAIVAIPALIPTCIISMRKGRGRAADDVFRKD